MAYRLQITRDGELVRTVELGGAGVVIGRRSTNDVVLDDLSISKVHARVTREGDSWYIEDQGSTNGVVHEGVKVKRAPLTLEKEFKVGNFQVKLVEEAAEPADDLGPAPRGAPAAPWEDLRALFRLNMRFASVMSTEELLNTMMDRLIEVFRADRGLVLLGNDPGALQVAVRRGTEMSEEELVTSRSVTGDALAQRAVVLKVGEGEMPLSVEKDVRSIMCAPLLAEDAALGVVYLDSRIATRIFGERDKQLLEAACENVVHAFRAAEERERLEKDVTRRRQLAREDALREHDFRDIVGTSPAIRECLSQVEAVAPQNVTVLVQGESGTGKELFAKAIHYSSDRRDAPFVAINCMALSPEIIESELFGHEKGAFSGAVARRIGKLEMADGGTVFLDEIGELNGEVQVKLLRVLQEREIQRVGGNETIRLDVRLVTATNVDLKQAVAAGTFREDLYYRLNVFSLQLPPLRRRKEDIPLLVDFFIDHLNESMGRAVEGVAPEALELLVAYDWPGNIRELRNVMERAMVLTRGDHIEKAALPFDLREAAGAAAADGPAAPPGGAAVSISEEMDMKEAKEALEKKMILDALGATSGNISAAARDLGIQRKTLHRKIEMLGIDMRDFGKQREALTRDEIVAALGKVRGSISAAARELGVPRTTLYRNMDMFGIDPASFRPAGS